MTTSTRESILAAVASKLIAANVAAGRVYRSQQEQIATLPAVITGCTGGRAFEVVLGAMDHEVNITVAVLATGDTPDSAADATLLAAHTALIADRSLGLGNGVQLAPDFEYESDLEKYDHARCGHRYTVTYRTTGNDF